MKENKQPKLKQTKIPDTHPIIRLNRRNRHQWESTQVERQRLASVGLARPRSRSRSPVRLSQARRNLSLRKLLFLKFLSIFSMKLRFFQKNFYLFLVFNDRGPMGGIPSVTPRTPRDPAEPGPSAAGSQPGPSAAGSESNQGFGTDDHPRMPDSDDEIEIPEVRYV